MNGSRWAMAPIAPYLHLVDGGVADNVGMRSVLMVLEVMEALQRGRRAHGARPRAPDRRSRRRLDGFSAGPLG